MKRSVIPVWKPVGWTPLYAIRELKKNNPEYANDKISYAGRLDPMAEGVLLLLVGEENKKRKEYEGLKKVYEAEIVLGISTDTFDTLGLVQGAVGIRPSLAEASEGKRISKKSIDDCLKTFLGKQSQKYPPFSSKAVYGKPLYWWAREGKLEEIELPKREIEIYEAEVYGLEFIVCRKMCANIIRRIRIVEGDFRQEEIIKGWRKFGLDHKEDEFVKITIKVECSSGTYIRRLASDLGEKLSCGAFAMSIKRECVGEYSREECKYL